MRVRPPSARSTVDPMNEFKRGTTPRTQVVLLSSNVTRLVLSVMITVVLGRALDANAFGFFALVNVIFVVGRELTDLGTVSIAVRAITNDPRRERVVLETLLGWRRILALAIAVLCAGFAFSARNDFQTITPRRLSNKEGSASFNSSLQ